MEKARPLSLRFTPTAFGQLSEITAYITIRNPRGARRVHARIKRTIDLLCDFPLMGRQTDDPSIRRVTTTPYPYLVYYQVTDSQIIVHAIRHGAREPDETS